MFSFHNKLILNKLIYFFSVVLMLSCQGKRAEFPTNIIPKISSKYQGDILVRDWQLLGPFPTDYATMFPPIDYDYLSNWETSEGDVTAEKFKSINKKKILKFQDSTAIFKNVKFQFQYHPPALHKIFNTKEMAYYYAACIIESEVEQDVGFLLGSDDGAKVWVNNKLCYRIDEGRGLKRNSDIFKIHLNKGSNFVLLKINNVWEGESTFYLTVSPVQYARELYLNRRSANFLRSSLISAEDSLFIEFDSSFISTQQGGLIEVLGRDQQVVLNKVIAEGKKWILPLNGMTDGVYTCKMYTDIDTLEQKFMYGDYQNVFHGFELKNTYIPQNSINSKINYETLLKRFKHLEEFAQENGYSNDIYRKLAIVLHELQFINTKLKEGKEAFKHVAGWHLRGFISKIDHQVENYMIYIPREYDKRKPIPLVVVFPWITARNMPFTESLHVADIDRIEMICRLADENGFAVLWSSSRIYERYNLNPISTTATLETIAAVKKDYNIDTTRMYGYGACSGGLSALLMANRYPSLFAAIGVEGPELSYTYYEKQQRKQVYPSEWVKENNIFNFIENYKKVPLYIVHSKNDEKAHFHLSEKLINKVTEIGGIATLDTLHHEVKNLKYELYPAGEVIQKLFKFFKNKKSISSPNEVSFSTAQLKYNRAYWLTINEFEIPRKATVKAYVPGNNIIEVETSFVKSFSLKISDIWGISKIEKLKIIANGKVVYNNLPTENILIELDEEETFHPLKKNHKVEGPINDFFKSSFMVVQGTKGSLKETELANRTIDSLTSHWQKNYYGNCIVKKDVEISKDDILNYNLILIGSPKSNLILKEVAEKLPLNVNEKSLRISGKEYSGDNIGYSFIYPNPLNSDKYILVIGSNNSKSIYVDPNFSYRGWFDYEIYDLTDTSVIDFGRFNEFWR